MSLHRVLLALSAVTLLVVGASAQPTPAPPPAPAKPKVTDVDAGPLYDQAEADKTCPTVCKAPLVWNGRWRTTKPGIMSVCACAEPAPPPPPPPPPAPPPAVGVKRDVDAGPLFNQGEATKKCPSLCKAPSTWTGAWHTTVKGSMSVCTCQDPPVKNIETTAIKNKAEAAKKCSKACAAPMQWTGEWTKVSKKVASCGCFDLPAPPPAASTPPPPVAPPVAPPARR